MVWWEAALWAVLGGCVVEGLEFSTTVRRYRRWPWRVDAEQTPEPGTLAAGPLGYAVGEAVRLAAGGVLGAALSDQVTGPLAALAIGAAAPALAGHLVNYVPLPPTPPALTPPASPVLDSAAPAEPPPTARPDPARAGEYGGRP